MGWRDHTPHGCHRPDVSAATFAHAWKHSQRDVYRAARHDADGVTKVIQRHDLGGPDLDDAGDCDGHGDRADVTFHLIHELLYLLGVCHIAHSGQERAVMHEEVLGLSQFATVSRGDHHPEVPVEKLAGDEETQAPGGPDHQCNWAAVHFITVVLPQVACIARTRSMRLMRALTWQGMEAVQVLDVPDPVIQEPTDAIVEVTSTAICGSDLHLYGVLAPYLTRGDVLGHEFMGVVKEVGSETGPLRVGDRVVVPFNISCGSCWMCSRGLFAQCETTQNLQWDKGASLFGYTSLYGAVPGGQAEYVRVPHADFGPVKVPEDAPDERYLYLSDILPTAWQGVVFADVDDDGTLFVLGAGPVGLMAVSSARYRGVGQVICADLVPERLAAAAARGATVIDLREVDDVRGAVRDLTSGRGADGVLDAVGMEAHGNPVAQTLIAGAARLPKPLAQKAIESAGIDRLAALHCAMECVRRGGTVSISGVYGGAADPMPLMDMFDKGIAIRMGQCHVKRWTDELVGIVEASGDPLGVESLATHRVPLEQAPDMYKTFRAKQDGCIKVVLKP